MRLVNTEKLSELQNRPRNIRNICIMAHVDHGKTTLADSLVASNGVISQRMAGKLRYMDSRKDEQERGITMKSSSIALYYKNAHEDEYLVNLIDSPGHVDFSSEVSTAVRLCDGAVIVVDIVEGVCPQTQVALKHAWLENIRPVLVLNKLDRLILEVKLSPLDAYVHLTQVLEQVNAVMASLFATDVMSRSEAVPSSGDQYKDWSDGLEQADDSQLYFSPDQGNVVFASAADGWGFCVRDFAAVYAVKLGVKQEALERTLWGDYYINTKTKRVMRGAQEKAKKCLFVQLVLENLWAVYENIVVRKDKDKLLKMSESLNVKMTGRDLRHTDPKIQLQAFCSQWLPLASTVLDMVCSKLPSPCDISEEKVERLMCSHNQTLDSLPPESRALKKAFLNCSSDSDVPIIVFISKMFPLERKSLPQNRPKVLSAEEIAQRREQARLRHANQLAGLGDGQLLPTEPSDAVGGEGVIEPSPLEEDDVFIAFARVFSGCLKKGSNVYVLGPKHNPALALQKLRQGEEIESNVTLKDLKAGHYVTKVTVSDLYLMMGRDLEVLEQVPAGNVLGIGGLDEHVLKTATLSTQLACPAFRELQLMAVPILRVAVEPTHTADLPALVKGLKLLNQADACVQVMVQETGEHVIVTAGEVHLERCIDDLEHRYAKVPVNASEPIVPFRETIVPPPTVDMVNEIIQDQQIVHKKDIGEHVDENGVVTMYTSNKQSMVRLRAAPLPPEVTTFLENNIELVRSVDRQLQQHSGDMREALEKLQMGESGERDSKVVEAFRAILGELLDKAGGEWSSQTVDQIWCFGPRRCGPNILINRTPGRSLRSLWGSQGCQSVLLEYESSFVNGFQMASLAGPLCEEPMMGVAFIVEDWTFDHAVDVNPSGVFGPLSGQIMSAVKEGCRCAFQAQPQRLMAAMYSCHIQANAEILGEEPLFFSPSAHPHKYKELYEKLCVDNSKLQARVLDLEKRSDESEQYSRLNTIEINGIPETVNENVLDLIQNVGRSLGVQVDEDMVDACHRLGSKRGTEDRPRGIVVKFTRRIVKEEILSKRRVKRNLNTSDIGLSNVIYMNESLTSTRRQVFNTVRMIKKEKGFAFVWIRNGKILVRPSVGDKVRVVTSMTDVEELRKLPATPGLLQQTDNSNEPSTS